MNKRLPVLLAATAWLAQAQAPVPASRVDSDRRVPTSGKVWVSSHTEPITTLRQMADASELVILGTVLLSYPSFRADASNPLSLETHVRVGIAEVLKGAVPGFGRFVRVAQLGGRLDDLEVENRDIGRFQAGERYLLFLQAAREDRFPGASDGAPLYRVTGVFAGAGRVDGEIVKFSPASHETLRVNNGVTVDALREKVLEIVENRLLPEHRTRLPLHPGPPDRLPEP